MALHAPCNDLTLRPGTAEDAALVLRMVQELARYERSEDQVEATPALIAGLLSGHRPAAEVVLAELHGQPAGFAVFFHTVSTWQGRRGLHLEDLFVRPQFRGRGVGTKLMSHLAAIAVRRGCGRFEWSVLNWNRPAIDFYRELGAIGMPQWILQRLSGAPLVELAQRFPFPHSAPAACSPGGAHRSSNR